MRKQVISVIAAIMMVFAALPADVWAVDGKLPEGSEGAVLQNEMDNLPEVENLQEEGEQTPDDQSGTDEESENEFGNLILTKLSKTGVKLTWEGDETLTYDVYMNDEQVTSITGLTADITDLTVGNEYSFYIRNQDEVSNSVSFTCRPDRITGLTAQSGYKSILLKWKASEDTDQYVIWKSSHKDFSSKSVVTVTGKTSRRFSAGDDVKYYYRVWAVKNGIKSGKYSSISRYSVRTIHYGITFKQTRTLGSGSHKHTFRAGTSAVAYKFSRGFYYVKYKGYSYKVSVLNTCKQNIAQATRKFDYTPAEAEDYVNRRGLRSKTRYLIWINGYTQREYVFKGSKGKWKCLYDWEIASGKAYQPSSHGVTYIHSKTPNRHGITSWCLLSVYSIHGTPYNQKKLGWPYSGGCIRNKDSHAIWIYKHCPLNTGVCYY